ncbi:methyltransferase domain-containing protein [Aneurinibacillus aneurinilyticus]|uniref:class I SAM-dependent methyltransferase n=1 Tax=Aneurinibacillus aneurinilyticus TaxID=1391 RepID=UPI002E1ADDB5|nr:methyltransferase domain-containing protein [Aneurinibacillus aneurinilyticus]MED0669738.1 methyltransferase domain-containing protein [Aneurinibacillus aneurinilyticus]
MNNTWNKMIYNLWAPFYDSFFNSALFLQARKTVFKDAPIPLGSRILFVGVGTGADLQLLTQKDSNVTAIDISPNMLQQAKKKYEHSQTITFMEMDAQHMSFSDESFDIVIANLVVSVVPDPILCMKEIIRVTQKEGYILIFDKFQHDNKKLSIGKRIIRPFISFLGTDIGRSFAEIVAPYLETVKQLESTPVLFNGMYRKILLQKIR